MAAACAAGGGFMDEFAYPPLHLEPGLWAARGIATPHETWEGGDVEAKQQELRARACTAFRMTGTALDQVDEPAPKPLRLLDGRLGWHCRNVAGLYTSCIGPSFFANALQQGITLFEPFGGMCAGLEMCLRNGIRVNRYLYVDKDRMVQSVASTRMQQLSHQYPSLFTPAAFRDAFALPQQVGMVNADRLLAAGARDGSQWLVVGGWECQDLSPAGLCRGLEGPHSSTYYDLLRLVGILQQLQLSCPPGYLLENTALQHNYRSRAIREEQFKQICDAFGEPVCFDAAQVGAYAHRLRNYWSNLAPVGKLGLVLQHMQGPAERRVQDILDPGRSVQPVMRNDSFPYFSANVKGQPMRALPTLVAYQGSMAFKDRRQGCLYDAGQDRWMEPNPDERERALGYLTGTTGAYGVSDRHLHEVTGRCMDAWALEAFMAASMVVSVQFDLAGSVSGFVDNSLGKSRVLLTTTPPLNTEEFKRCTLRVLRL